MGYGWEEGQGLGRQENGRVECVQAIRREDKQGLGARKRKTEDQWDNWWADCFNNVAKKLNVKTVQKDSDSSNSSSEEDTVTKNIVTSNRATVMKGKLRRVQRQDKT